MGEMLLQVPAGDPFSAQPLAVCGKVYIGPDGTWGDLTYREGGAANVISISPQAVVLHYATGGLFEGMQAWRQPDGSWCLVDPTKNAERMIRGMHFMGIPPFSVEWFMTAVHNIVQRTLPFVHESVNKLYIRPALVPVGPKLGLGFPFISPQHAHEAGCWSDSPGYLFVIYASPVGDYFSPPNSSTINEISLFVDPEYDRAPRGGAAHKMAANYCMNGVHNNYAKREYDCDQVLYVSPDGKFTECGAANVMTIDFDGNIRIAQPNSLYVLPGTTQERIVQLVEKEGCTVLRVPSGLDDLDAVRAMVATGTAAGLVSVHKLVIQNPNGHRVDFRYVGRVAGSPVNPSDETRWLVGIGEKYQQILRGKKEDVFGWLVPVEG